MVERSKGLNTPGPRLWWKGGGASILLFYEGTHGPRLWWEGGREYSSSMKGHMDPDYGGKVEGLKYSYSVKGHMDPDYGGKVERWRGLNTPIL